jgi:hypothetical protein
LFALLAWIGVLAGPALAGAAACSNSGVPGAPYEGFGADTTGGAGRPVYRVTTLADSGPGSLRDALSAGNRCIVFEVAGEIVLHHQVYVSGSFVTIDGFTAPAPGITVRDYGVGMWGSNGAHDVILRGLRFRNAGQRTCPAGECWDGVQVKNGAYRIVIDHVSIDHASDGGADISSQVGSALTRDVTVQWSMFSGTTNQSLLQRATRVSMHHNLFINGQNRNPQADWDPTLATAPTDTVLDFRNNVVWNFSSYGTLIRRRATANVVGNYYYSPSRPTAAHALVVDMQGRAHAASNTSGNGANINSSGTEQTAFPAVPVSITDACRAAYEVQEDAGARGANVDLDAVDSAHLARMSTTQMPGCSVADATPVRPAPTTPPPNTPLPVVLPTPLPTPVGLPDLAVTSISVPSTVYSGLTFPIQFGVTNRGSRPTAGSRLRIYLSTDAQLSAGDVLLRDRYTPEIAAGASQWTAISEVVPPEVTPGSYYLLLVSDAAGTASESNERNNTMVAEVTVSRPIPTTPIPDLVTTGVSVPSTLQRGAGFPLRFTVVNRGTGTAGASRVKIYLSTDAAVSSRDVLLRSRYIPALAPGAAESVSITEMVPLAIRPGSYKVLTVVDPDSAVRESNEPNNITVTSVTVR